MKSLPDRSDTKVGSDPRPVTPPDGRPCPPGRRRCGGARPPTPRGPPPPRGRRRGRRLRGGVGRRRQTTGRRRPRRSRSPPSQFQTPMGTECIDVPLTSSTGSHPMEWSTSSSSIDSRTSSGSRPPPAGRARASAAARCRPGRRRVPAVERAGRSQQADGGRGAGMGSKSLNRRTRLPRRMHSMVASPSPSSRRVVVSDAPWSESDPAGPGSAPWRCAGPPSGP